MKKLFLSLPILLFLAIGALSGQKLDLPPLPSVLNGLDRDFETIWLPALNTDLIQREDQIRLESGQLELCGRLQTLDRNTANSGNWTILENGDRIWRLNIVSPGALAMSMYFEEFDLPRGTALYIYTPDLTEINGPYTAEKNQENGVFASGITEGEAVILEYVVPKGMNASPAFTIAEVGHIYREGGLVKPKGFGDSENCEVNQNCSEGADWPDQSKSIGRILLTIPQGMAWCTGAFVNNTAGDCSPYFLTAWHCGEGATTANLNQWLFFFNYEAVGCISPASEGTLDDDFMVGASILAHSNDGGGATGSDFLLLNMNQNIPASYGVYMAGWSKVNSGSSSGVSIHHPAGDIKKISTYSTTLVSTTWGGIPNTHWSVQWSPTTNGHGVTEGGSSGAPIFNNNKHIVGTLTGGGSFCTAPTTNDAYGKLSYHWQSNGFTSDRRLSPWLDPGLAGSNSIDGIYFPCVSVPNDAGVVSIIEPNGVVCGATFTPTVRLRNYGTSPLTTVTVNYTINAGPVVSGVWNGNLPSGQFLNVSFPDAPLPGGSFTFEAYTTNPNNSADGNAGNDAASSFNNPIATQNPPFTQAFEFPIFPPSGMILDNPDGDDFKWARTTAAGGFGNSAASAYMNNFDGDSNNNPRGTFDWLILPAENLSSTINTTLSFDVAHTLFASSQSPEDDSLILAYSVDCGATFFELWRAGGAAFITAPPTDNPFVPSSSQWRTETFDLSFLDGEASVYLALINKSDWGNNTFIDNINLFGASVGTSEPDNLARFDVFPNPGQGLFNLNLEFTEAQDWELLVFNSLGQKLFALKGSQMETNELLDLSSSPAGVYFLTVKSGNAVKTKRLVISK